MKFLSRVSLVLKDKMTLALMTTMLILIGIFIIKKYEILNNDIRSAKILLLGTFAMLLPTLAILIFAITYTRQRLTNINIEFKKETDEQRLLNVKRKYLDSILEQLKLEVDEDLKQCLEESNIDGANDLIKDKIEALNALVETVKGDDTKVLRGTDISTIANFYDSTNNRIQGEIKRIKDDSSINMRIGVSASIAAIGILLYTVLEHKIELMEIIPRATVSLLIEAFAFFFFSQYRKQQEEIKYWNNEKTNLDLKIFALSIAIEDDEIGTKEYMRNLINSLIQTDRNIFSGEIDKKQEKVEEKKVEGGTIDDVLKKVKEFGELVEKNKNLFGK